MHKDAYAFNALDLNTEWSGLPSHKKRMRESGKFRLPIKIPGCGSGSGKVEEEGDNLFATTEGDSDFSGGCGGSWVK